MTALAYCTVIGKFADLVADAADGDTHPDAAPLVGQVTLSCDARDLGDNPTTARLLLPTETPPRTITVEPFPVTLDGSGQFSVEVPATGQTGVTVPSVFTYTASFALKTATGAKVRIPSFSFAAPAGTTVDLAIVAPAATENGVNYIVGAPGTAGPAGPGGIVAVDNGDGTIGLSGTGVTDNGDGTFTIAPAALTTYKKSGVDALRGAANGLATLDGTSKIPAAQLPSLRIVSVSTVANQAARLALSVDDDAQFVVQSDTAVTYMLAAGANPAVNGNWTAMPQPSTAGLELASNKGAANGYAPLNGSSRVPIANLGSGTPTGSKFLRDDGAFAVPAGGGGGTALTGSISGCYYSAPVSGNYGAGAGTLGLLICHEIFLGAGTLDRLEQQVLAAGAAGETLRLGIYNDNGHGYPGTLLIDGGTTTADLASTGRKFVSISQAVTAGRYYLGLVRQGTSATATLITNNLLNIGSPNTNLTTGNIYATYTVFTQSSVTAALPSTFTSTVTLSQNAAQPLVWARYA